MSPALRRLIAAGWLTAWLATSAASASAAAGTAPYSVSDLGPARGTEFRISDIDPAPTPGYDATDHSDHAPDASADLFKISDVSSR